MKFWLLTGFLVLTIVGSLWGAKYGYRSTSNELSHIVTDPEFHRLRKKHCGLNADCVVVGWGTKECYFKDKNGRVGRFR